MEDIPRSPSRETSLTSRRVEVDDTHWAVLEPRVMYDGHMYIFVCVHFPSDGEEYLREKLESLVADEYADLCERASCGHWTLLNHTQLDDHGLYATRPR
ncbi:MAG: hypothetical protein U0136_12715 [Bdellovibrionota bacterium]